MSDLFPIKALCICVSVFIALGIIIFFSCEDFNCVAQIATRSVLLVDKRSRNTEVKRKVKWPEWKNREYERQFIRFAYVEKVRWACQWFSHGTFQDSFTTFSVKSQWLICIYWLLSRTREGFSLVPLYKPYKTLISISPRKWVITTSRHYFYPRPRTE